MFGLDIMSIIAGAVGGGVGAGLGALIGQIFSNTRARSTFVAALTAAGIAISNPIIKPLLDGQFGATVRGGQFDTAYEAEVLPGLKNVPALQRVFRDHPEVEARFRAKAREAYEKGGAQELVEESPAIGAAVLADAFVSYLPRARGEDLISFAKTMGDVLNALDEKDPEACILYQFGTTYGKPLGQARLLAAIGEERQHKQLDVMNAVVVNAGDKPVPFDDAKATLALTSLAQNRAPLLTGQSAEVAQGRRPPADAAEAKAACSFGASLFNDIAAKDAPTAEIILRKMFASGG